MGSGRILVEGEARGDLVPLGEPLSFWGGFDAESGAIIDVRHPQHGLVITGKIVAMRHGRGSSSSSSVLAEAIRSGTAPSGIVIAESDAILALGSLVAGLLYDSWCPIVLLGEADYADLTAATGASIDASGLNVTP